MSKFEDKNAAKRAASREKILTAATALFARKGLAGTGVQEIADAADLSVGMLYRHFKTKEDVFGALAEKAMDDMKAFCAFLEIEMPPADMIKMTVSNVMEYMDKDDGYAQFQTLLYNIMSNVSVSLPHVMEEVWKTFHSFRDNITRLIERGQNDGSFREGCAKGMTTMFLAIMQGLPAFKMSMGDGYVSPSPQMLTAFLLKDEYNVYEAETRD